MLCEPNSSSILAETAKLCFETSWSRLLLNSCRNSEAMIRNFVKQTPPKFLQKERSYDLKLREAETSWKRLFLNSCRNSEAMIRKFAKQTYPKNLAETAKLWSETSWCSPFLNSCRKSESTIWNFVKQTLPKFSEKRLSYDIMLSEANSFSISVETAKLWFVALFQKYLLLSGHWALILLYWLKQ